MLSRNVTTKIAFVLDELIPPILRDARWFMWIPFRILFGDKSEAFFRFKDRAFDMSFEEFKGTYEALESVHIQRETDLNEACTRQILENISGGNVLEVGCGRVYLAQRLQDKAKVTACDMVISDALREKFPHIDLREASIEDLPFADDEFDTVVSTHTLEHVLDLEQAIVELRRVARKRLIIVVPKQRPYRYTFDLHIHFFPYQWSLLAHMKGASGKREIKLLDGDWYYQEEL
ncbi:MAG: ubiquinone/menaquinone biosynthesis C-methylase UbiE [Halioglobus sp.]|jgi:ubiquinone/menaquinone biosynthesis C-methylase UbiE